LNDVPGRGRNIAARAGNYHRHVLEAGKWQEAVQGYLASISFADAMLGQLLDGLEASGHADDTIVVLWSDHGWQLGEKEHWRKFALWENVSRVVMMMRVPQGIAPTLMQGTAPGSSVWRVTSLIDLFPTLTGLAGLATPADLDGRSLVPLLAEPERPWPHVAITTYDYDEFSVRDEAFRYIRYIDGGEELYDHRVDPEEWENLADDPAYAGIRDRLRAQIPQDAVPMGPTIELMPHHTPPFESADQYRRYIEAQERR
jgi:arylsulfatase A-like enzyme